MEEHLWSSFETRSVFYFSLKIHFDFYMLKLSTPAFVERLYQPWLSVGQILQNLLQEEWQMDDLQTSS